MNEPIDTIQDIEEVITDLQVMSDPRNPIIALEICRLDQRLRQIEEQQPVFSQPV